MFSTSYFRPTSVPWSPCEYNRFGNEYASPAPVIDMVQYKDIDVDSKPYLTFEFKYKPLGQFISFTQCSVYTNSCIDLLVANNIAPRALHILSPTPPPSTLLGEDHKSRELSGPDVCHSLCDSVIHITFYQNRYRGVKRNSKRNDETVSFYRTFVGESNTR